MSHVTRWRNFFIDQIEKEIASFLVLGAAGPLPSLRGNLIVAGGHDNERSKLKGGEKIVKREWVNQKDRSGGFGRKPTLLCITVHMITPAIFNCIPVDGFELFNHLSN